MYDRASEVQLQTPPRAGIAPGAAWIERPRGNRGQYPWDTRSPELRWKRFLIARAPGAPRVPLDARRARRSTGATYG